MITSSDANDQIKKNSYAMISLRGGDLGQAKGKAEMLLKSLRTEPEYRKAAVLVEKAIKGIDGGIDTKADYLAIRRNFLLAQKALQRASYRAKSSVHSTREGRIIWTQKDKSMTVGKAAGGWKFAIVQVGQSPPRGRAKSPSGEEKSFRGQRDLDRAKQVIEQWFRTQESQMREAQTHYASLRTNKRDSRGGAVELRKRLAQAGYPSQKRGNMLIFSRPVEPAVVERTLRAIWAERKKGATIFGVSPQWATGESIGAVKIAQAEAQEMTNAIRLATGGVDVDPDDGVIEDEDPNDNNVKGAVLEYLREGIANERDRRAHERLRTQPGDGRTKSRGHLAFVGRFEYFVVKERFIYRAPRNTGYYDSATGYKVNGRDVAPVRLFTASRAAQHGFTPAQIKTIGFPKGESRSIESGEGFVRQAAISARSGQKDNAIKDIERAKRAGIRDNRLDSALSLIDQGKYSSAVILLKRILSNPIKSR